MVGGWELGQTRQPPSLSDPLCVCVCVLSPLPSQTIEQALCLIGVSWWLPGGTEGRGREVGGGRYQTLLSDLCVWMQRERDQKKRRNNQTAVWITCKEQERWRRRREKEDKEMMWATRLPGCWFYWLPHTSFTTWLKAARLNWVKMLKLIKYPTDIPYSPTECSLTEIWSFVMFTHPSCLPCGNINYHLGYIITCSWHIFIPKGCCTQFR